MHAVDEAHRPETVDPVANLHTERFPDRLLLDDALDQLSDDLRIAVVLRDVADLDYAEIAEVLDVPVGTVKSRISRGRAALAAAAAPRRRSARNSWEPIGPRRASNGSDMNDDLTLLASAYLDGDVTADERARVENDTEALAEVDRLRSVRALLGDVEPQAISVREAQLAAALEVWDRLPERERTGARRDGTPAGIDAAAVAGAASVTAPTPLSSRRRSGRGTSTRWLTGAAAALVLVLAGRRGTPALVDRLRRRGIQRGDFERGRGRSAHGDRAPPTLRTLPPVTCRHRQPEAAEAADEATLELDTGIDNAAPPGENVGLDQLDNLTDLADFAAAAVGAPISPDDVPAATSAAGGEDLSEAETFLAEAELPRCLGVDIIVGPAVYRDVPVVVGIDESRNLAIAYRAVDCAEVARARLP